MYVFSYYLMSLFVYVFRYFVRSLFLYVFCVSLVMSVVRYCVISIYR